jgi:hypothetical protein
MLRRTFEAIGLAVVILACVCNAARADTFDGAYRGMIVCEKLKNSQFILRAPMDIMINGKAVVAARPVCNLKGALGVASEIATGTGTGTVADDGTINFNSTWHGGGASFQGSYKGVISGNGGTLTGTQDWTTATGKEVRSCTAAVVQTGS